MDFLDVVFSAFPARDDLIDAVVFDDQHSQAFPVRHPDGLGDGRFRCETDRGSEMEGVPVWVVLEPAASTQHACQASADGQA